jgi:TP901 family phage tail tape measure protein
LANNLNLGIVVGASTSSSVGQVFRGINAQASQLGKSLQQVRLGRAASDDVLKYQRQLASLNEGQRQWGVGNTRLWGQIAETERHLRAASATAERYGINVGDIVRENDRLIRSERILGGQLQRSQTLQANRARRSELGGKMLGTAGMAIGAAYTIAQPLRQALSFEHELRLFGNVVNFNNIQLGETKSKLNAIATATNQTPGELLSALNTLASKGLDPSRAVKSLAIIGKAATATGADVNELATTSFTLIDAMGLKPTELPKAMDMLAQAGKLGSFELKDMATYFPQLTAQAKSLGITGTQGIATMGAALQIAMKGASDPAQAANNFQNFLTKLTSQETVKRFQKMGVNVQKVMTEATQKGADPVIAMVETIQEITGGNKFKMSELFSDMQVLGFLNPMIANLDEFNRIKKESLEANNVINKDYAAMMATGTEQLKAAGIEAQKLSVTIGSALGPALNDIVTGITPVIQGFAQWAGNNKPIIAGIIELGIGLIGMKVAMLGGAYAVSLLSSGWTIATGVAAFFSNSLIGTRIGLAALAVQTKLAAAGQWLMNTAFLGCPVVWIIGGIAAIGAAFYLLWKNWDTVSAWIKSSWEAIGTSANNLVGVISGAFATMASSVRSVWEPVMAWFRDNFTWLGSAIETVKKYASQVGSITSSVGKFMTTPVFGAGSSGKGAAVGAAMAATMALPAGANTALPALPGAKAPQTIHQTTNATIHVTQKPGEDGEALANRVVSKIKRQESADKRRALHD